MATPTELLGQARAAGAVRKPAAKPGMVSAGYGREVSSTAPAGFVRKPLAAGASTLSASLGSATAGAGAAKMPFWRQLRDMGMQGTGSRAGNRAALEAARMPPDAVMPPEGAPMDGDRAEMIAAAARSALGTEAPAGSGPRPIGPRPFIPTEAPQGGGGPQTMLPTEVPQAPAGIANPWEDLGRLGALMPPPRRRRPDIGGGVDRGMGRELATAEGYGR